MSLASTSLLSLSERLQSVTEALAAARTGEDVFGVVLTPALQALSAVAGAILLVDDSGARLEVAARQGDEQAAQTLWQDGPLDGHVPASDALKRHEPLFFEREGDLVRAYPELEARTGGVANVATAVLPMFLDDRPLGVILLDFKEPHEFTPEETRFLRTLASQCALAVGRTRLLTDLQRQVEERTVRIEEGARAQEAFVAFTEAVGTTTDVLTLARQAIQVLRARFQDGSIAYHTKGTDLWRPQAWSEDMGGALVARLRAGLPDHTPFIRRALETSTTVFTDGWDPQREGIEPSEDYGSAAASPLVVDGEVRGLLLIGLKDTRRWSERDRTLVRAVGRGLTLALERAEQARQLRARGDAEERRTQALAAFAELSRDLVLETDPLVLIQRTQETVLALLPAGFSVYFEPREGLWRIGSQVGHANTPELQAALDAGLPFVAASNLLTPWQSGEPFYQDEYDPDLDQLTGSDEYPGASVTLPIMVDGQTRGILGFALYTQRRWSGEDRAVLETVGRQLTLALERAEQTRQLEEERAALDAFARFTEASTHTQGALTLAQGAKDVLLATLGVEVGYSELEDGLWKGRVFSETTPPEVMAQAKKGFPADLPGFARPFTEGDVVFVDGWDPQGAEHTEVYGAAALYPYFEDGQPHGLLTMGLAQARAWTERERSVFRSVGRSLALAFERTEHARQLQVQNAELDARTRALEGFAELTRDLSVEVDPYVLIRRAQEVALSLLPEGYALYFEPEGDRWVLHGQTGDLRSEALQAAADVGLPYDEANNLLIPYRSLKPYYQDQYRQDTDHLEEMVAHLGASVTLPVIVDAQVRGVFAVVLFGGARHWTRPDQAALESVVRSLGLALERAEQAREISEWRERYEVAVKGSGHLLYDWNPATDAMLYGGAVEQITGYTADELDGNLGDWTERLIHPDDREAFGREIRRVIASSDEFHLPFRVVLKDGSVREVEDDGYFKRDERGQVTRMAGFVRDVTERRRAEAALQHSNEELRRSNAELEQFAYIASHDLQAPIRAVTSFAGVIDRRYGSTFDERGRLYLRQIVESGEHMKRLVDDLLTFSRVHTEQRPLRRTDSGVVFDAVLGRLHPEIEALGASVTRGELPQVVADAQQLDQLLQNLITNGLKYRREGVSLRVHVSTQRDGAWWRFAVSDNGIGIEGQYFERIFEIFQRLHGREEYEGTGIGLAVCKKIVERHGGRLWLESTPGQGTTFFFTLPVA